MQMIRCFGIGTARDFATALLHRANIFASGASAHGQLSMKDKGLLLTNIVADFRTATCAFVDQVLLTGAQQTRKSE